MLQEEDELHELQLQEWQPILNWFCERYKVKLEATRDISAPTISQETKSVLTKHLLSYNFWAVHGRWALLLNKLKSLKKKLLMKRFSFQQIGGSTRDTLHLSVKHRISLNGLPSVTCTYI
jgi:hypothetical protein